MDIEYRRKIMTGKRSILKIGISLLNYETEHLGIRRFGSIVKTITDLQKEG